jgi:hypothetical protein
VRGDSIDLRTADVTATLTHIAGLLNSLPLDELRDNLAADIRRAAEADPDAELASAKHRRARRGALLAAIAGAHDFVTGIQDALAHNRAVVHALQLEASAASEERPVDHPSVLVAQQPRPPEVHRLFRQFPGAANVIPFRREESLTDDEPA